MKKQINSIFKQANDQERIYSRQDDYLAESQHSCEQDEKLNITPKFRTGMTAPSTDTQHLVQSANILTSKDDGKNKQKDDGKQLRIKKEISGSLLLLQDN